MRTGFARRSRRMIGALLLGLLAFVLEAGSPNRIQSSFVPPGSQRLAQVIYLGQRELLKKEKWLYDILTACGVKDEDIRDGSVVLGRIYCCGGPNEGPTAMLIYVPPAMQVELGDIVEVLVGSESSKTDPGKLNTLTKIRQKASESNGPCRWDPPDDRKWARILYADWMKQEGWVHKGGLYPAWYKPPADKKPND